ARRARTPLAVAPWPRPTGWRTRVSPEPEAAARARHRPAGDLRLQLGEDAERHQHHRLDELAGRSEEPPGEPAEAAVGADPHSDRRQRGGEHDHQADRLADGERHAERRDARPAELAKAPAGPAAAGSTVSVAVATPAASPPSASPTTG